MEEKEVRSNSTGFTPTTGVKRELYIFDCLLQLSRKSSTPLFLKCDSSVIDTMAKVLPSIALSVSRRLDHGLTHGFWLQCRPQTFTWSLALADATDLSMVSCGSVKRNISLVLCYCMGPGHQPQPLVAAQPRTSMWLQVAV